MKNVKYRFKIGEDVAHKDNLEIKMVVSRILTQTKELKPKDGSKDHALVQEKKSYLIGIECHWWEEGKLRRDKFHSRELVPFHIAKSGKDTVMQWLLDR